MTFLRCFLLLPLLVLLLVQPLQARTLLHGAWTPDEAGLLNSRGVAEDRALPWELKLLDLVGEQTGIGFAFQALEGNRIEPALNAGKIDFALPHGASHSANMVLSVAYGSRREMLFFPASSAQAHDGLAQLEAIFRAGHSLAITPSQRPASVTNILTRFAAADRLLVVGSDAQAMRAMLTGRAQAALAEKLIGLNALASSANAADLWQVFPRPLLEAPQHIAFASGTVDAPTIAAINSAITELQPRVRAMRDAEARPILLRYTIAAQPWFAWFEVIGLIAFALSGVLLAKGNGWSLFGAFVLASLPAVGGGVLRDLLVGRQPIYLLEGPLPMLIVAGVVVGGYLVIRLFYRLGDGAQRRLAWLQPAVLQEVTAAVGLAALTVTGVLVAMRFGAQPLWLWGPLLAALTGVGGGIMRDVLRLDPKIPALRSSFYAEVCLLWGLFLSVSLLKVGDDVDSHTLPLLVVGTMLGVMATRLLFYVRGWPTLRFG